MALRPGLHRCKAAKCGHKVGRWSKPVEHWKSTFVRYFTYAFWGAVHGHSPTGFCVTEAVKILTQNSTVLGCDVSAADQRCEPIALTVF